MVFRGSLQTLASVPPPRVVWRGDTTHLPRETLILTAREEACTAAAERRRDPSRGLVDSRRRSGDRMLHASAPATTRASRRSPTSRTKSADDWSRLLPDLLPAINACVAREGAALKAVAGGRAARLGNGESAAASKPPAPRSIARVDASGRGTPALAPVAAATRRRPRNPLFYPPREPPPLVSCGKLERVHTQRGALAGYLHYDPC